MFHLLMPSHERFLHGGGRVPYPISCVRATQIVRHPTIICTKGEYHIMTSKERREARYHRRQARRLENKRARCESLGGLKKAFSYRKMFFPWEEVLQRCRLEAEYPKLRASPVFWNGPPPERYIEGAV